MKKYIFSLILLTLLHNSSIGQSDQFEFDLINLIKPFKGKVGVAIKNLNTNDQIEINGNEKFPMQSVFKFPLALAVFDRIDQEKLSFYKKMEINESDLLPNTYSPLRDQYPKGKKDITLEEILQFTVSQSDNNGCDYLFKILGGPNEVNTFIQKAGFKNIAIVSTEAQMHLDSTIQYANYSSPLAMNQILEKFYLQKIISKKSTAALWNMMVNSKTGATKLKAKLPSNIIIGDKTGWSGVGVGGFTAATNDVGIFIIPNGHAIAISVFVANTFEKTEICDALISKISKLAYDFYSKK